MESIKDIVLYACICNPKPISVVEILFCGVERSDGHLD
jgi:hypothetical protein